MSVDPNIQIQQNAPSQATPSDKELNFRKQEQMYQKMLAEKEARIAELQQQRQNPSSDDEDNDDEPYIDKRKLGKALAKERQTSKQETQQDIKTAVSQALTEERRQNWMKNNPDFYEVMGHAEKFAQRDPELAETILEMPESFERQKLVYKNIKALGLHKPEEKPSIQNKIDQNRRSPFYQPTGMSGAPYASQSDFSAAGQKNAYDKMQELKRNLRLG